MASTKETPSPEQALAQLDAILSAAQTHIGSHISNMETKTKHPKAYAKGVQVFDLLEQSRRRLKK